MGGKEWRALAQERGQEVQQLRRQLDLFCSAPLAEDAFGAPGPGKPGPEGSPLLAAREGGTGMLSPSPVSVWMDRIELKPGVDSLGGKFEFFL